jgi:hypothetical protein
LQSISLSHKPREPVTSNRCGNGSQAHAFLGDAHLNVLKEPARKRARQERAAVRTAIFERVERRGQRGRGAVGYGVHLDASQEIRVACVRQQGDRGLEGGDAEREVQVEQGGAAAQREFAAVRVDYGEKACRVGAKVDSIGADAEAPRL